MAVSRLPKGARRGNRVPALLGARTHFCQGYGDKDQLGSGQNSRTPIPCVCYHLRVAKRQEEFDRLDPEGASSFHK